MVVKKTRTPLEHAKHMALLETSPVVHSAAEVQKAIDQLAVRIDLALHTENPLVIVVLQGGLYLAGQLLPRLRFPLNHATLQVSRYGDDIQGHSLRWISPLSADVSGRIVLLVDDVLDEGITLRVLVDHLRGAGASQVLTAVLVRKSPARETGVSADFIGLESGAEYLFGCGMDCRGYWRNLPEIRALREPEGV